MRDAPRYSSATDPAVAEFQRDTRDALLRVPDFEWREFETMANMTSSAPLPVKLQIVSKAMGVFIGAAFEKADPRATVTCGSPSWQRSAGGIEIYNLDGLTAGTAYVVRLLVVGE